MMVTCNTYIEMQAERKTGFRVQSPLLLLVLFFLLLLNKKWPDNLSYNSPVSDFMNTCSVLPGLYAKRRRDARRTEEILIHDLQG